MDVFITFLPLLIILAAKGETAAVYKQPLQDWEELAKEELKEALKNEPTLGVAKNVIVFLGDGMGVSDVTASRVYNAQRLGKSFRDAQMSFEKFPYLGLSMTYSIDRFVTGSAAAASALLCGEKARTGTIGVNQNVFRGRCDQVAGNELTSILEHSHAAGKWTGIISNARLTHPSPAAAYASSAERSWEADRFQPPPVRSQCKDIAKQLIEDNDYIRVLLGGGRATMIPGSAFDPEYPTKKGFRQDGRNLIDEWMAKRAIQFPDPTKYKYVRNQAEFDAVDSKNVEYLLGMFEPSHMHYEVDRKDSSKNPWPEPSIAEMTEKAIKILERSNKGYFLFVEAGRIDHAHHKNNAFRALNETVALSDAVQKAVDMTKEKDTLIIVTADHSHVFTMGGFSSIDTNILGLGTEIANGTETVVDLADDELPYTILSYANGPSHNYHHTKGSISLPNAMRKNLTEDESTGKIYEPDYKQDAAIPLRAESHSGEEVAVYARGPMGHLFHKTQEQTLVAHVMAYASCVGPYTNRTKCDETHVNSREADDFKKGQENYIDSSGKTIVCSINLTIFFALSVFLRNTF